MLGVSRGNVVEPPGERLAGRLYHWIGAGSVPTTAAVSMADANGALERASRCSIRRF
jgi:hypothetical protein